MDEKVVQINKNNFVNKFFNFFFFYSDSQTKNEHKIKARSIHLTKSEHQKAYHVMFEKCN